MQIDTKTLPCMTLSDSKSFPQVSCIYFAIDSLGCVHYVGKTKNLNSRWKNHQCKDRLLNIGGIKIAYLILDDSSLGQVEKDAILFFSPPLNAFDLNRDFISKQPRDCSHTDRPIYAKGLCKSCYDIAHRKKSTKLKCDREYEERNRKERNRIRAEKAKERYWQNKAKP